MMTLRKTSNMTFSITTLSIMKLTITTFYKVTHNIKMSLRIVKTSIKILRITALEAKCFVLSVPLYWYNE
jgi:hypothetical protein